MIHAIDAIYRRYSMMTTLYKKGELTDHDIDGGREDENCDDGGVMLDNTLPLAHLKRKSK